MVISDIEAGIDRGRHTADHQKPRGAMKEKRNMRPNFSVALIAITHAPYAVLADHPHQAQPAPVHDDGHHHDAAAPPHNHTTPDNHDRQGHRYGHTILQWLHNLLRVRYHRNGTCAEHFGTQHSR
jgi:hypothetical protein